MYVDVSPRCRMLKAGAYEYIGNQQTSKLTHSNSPPGLRSGIFKSGWSGEMGQGERRGERMLSAMVAPGATYVMQARPETIRVQPPTKHWTSVPASI